LPICNDLGSIAKTVYIASLIQTSILSHKFGYLPYITYMYTLYISSRVNQICIGVKMDFVI